MALLYDLREQIYILVGFHFTFPYVTFCNNVFNVCSKCTKGEKGCTLVDCSFRNDIKPIEVQCMPLTSIVSFSRADLIGMVRAANRRQDSLMVAMTSKLEVAGCELGQLV